MLRVRAAGWRAHAALRASGGTARVVAPLSQSFYAEAAGELIWVGNGPAPLHPRAVLVHDARAPGEIVRIDLDRITPWRPSPFPRIESASTAAERLRAALAVNGEMQGLASLLTSDAHDDAVIRRARPHVEALARAAAANDAAAFAAAARSLLGLGAGLTPSGDDVVGGALFARRLLIGTDSRWDATVAAIATAASSLTHPISARLLLDLAAGEGWAPLHELTAALAGPVSGVVDAVRRVTTLGHASGWDLLLGVLTGLGAASAAPESAGTTS